MNIQNTLGKLRYPSGYVPAAVLVLSVLLPLALTSSWIGILVSTLIMAGAASSWNLFGGYTGYFSLGHGVFFGVGAYTTAILFTSYGIAPVWTIFVGMAIALVVSWGLGKATLTLDGHYFALATLGALIIAEELASYFSNITGGPAGLMLPFEPAIVNLMFRDRLFNYYIALGYLLLVVLITIYIDNRKWGYYLKGIREDEDASEMLGVNTERMKLVAFGLSAMLTSLGGSIWMTYTFLIDPAIAFDMFRSIYFILYPLIGGLGTITGPIIGTVLIEPIPDIFGRLFGGSFASVTNVMYGLILMVVVVIFPEGIVKRGQAAYHSFLARLPVIGATDTRDHNAEEN